jgi:hypothetical protein
MNPIYCNEIRADLARLGLSPEIIPIFEEEQNRSASH